MTILIPWAMNIRNAYDKFILPIIYTLITIVPSIISYFKIFGSNEESASIKTVLPKMILELVITIKAPIALGIYFITLSTFSLVEDIVFRIYSKNKVFV